MREHAIVVEGLRKSYKKLKVLEGISFTVEKGAVLALLGPNGAGKTTTVRIMSTLLRPDGGRVLIHGHDVVKDSDTVRSLIGLTGQSASVDEYLTGEENLKMMGRLYHLSYADAARRAKELLVQFHLADAAKRAVKHYSGGMRRRLDLAASLIASPPVIFLDEPTTGLDPRSRLQLWQIIKQLAQSGTTVLLTTQYMEEADYLADTITVINGGKVIAEGTPGELKQKIGAERMELTLKESQSMDEAEKIIGSDAVHRDNDQRLISTALSGGVHQMRETLQKLEEAGVGIDSVTLRRPTLDDVFLSLTGHSATTEESKKENGDTMPSMPTLSRLTEKVGPEKRPKIFWVLSDGYELIKRSLKHILKNMDQLMGVLIQPIMFLLLFRYVFGGAINTGETSYVNFLIAGILIQNAAFGATTTALNLALDLKRGIVDRFQSLPMTSSALLIGHVVADLVRNTLAGMIMLGVGLLVGFQPTATPAEWLLVILLLLLFTMAISWLSAVMGLLAKSVEAVQWMSFLIIFPFTFASSAFVPTESMPWGLRIFAENQPVTHVIGAMRSWLVGTPIGDSGYLSFGWCLLILIVTIPVTARLFRRHV